MNDELVTAAGRTRPVYNFNTITNLVLTRTTRVRMVESLVDGEEIFPDVSFYQGDINWDIMSAHTRAIIIRASQQVWPDSKFLVNWSAAKQKGLLRGLYHFYDGRAAPKDQAATVEKLVKDDLPEMEIWVDWERNYGGRWEGLKNVVAMMQRLEELLPGVEVGMYTGYYFMIANSNAILNSSEYKYLATKPLWLAQYVAPTSKLLIPAPWTQPPRVHQYGTPVVGRAYGTQSLELDMNRYSDAEKSFNERYNLTGGPKPPPSTSNGEQMTTISPPEWKKVTADPKMNIRNTAGVVTTASDIGDLPLNSLVLVDQSTYVGTVLWYHLIDGASPTGVHLKTADGRLINQRTDCWVSGDYLVPATAPVPTEPPTVKPDELHINVDIVAGKITGTISGVAQGKEYTVTY